MTNADTSHQEQPVKPTTGQIVFYTLTEDDAALITERRGKFGTVANAANAGQPYPALVITTFSGGHANLQVLLDGPDTYWATSRGEGDGNGEWTRKLRP